MAKTEAQKRANAIFNKKTYERIAFELRKDSEINGEVLRNHAAAMGESVNSFLKRAVAETMERDKSG